MNEFRLEFARLYENTETFNPDRMLNIAERIRESSYGVGVDSTIVATSSPSAFKQALTLTRRGGKILLFGVPSRDSNTTLNLNELYSSELSIASSYGCSEIETNQALSLISEGLIEVDPLITHRFDIEESAEAFRLARAGVGVMKVIINS
jgi:L-iditol 2-dehydrogenase